MGEEKRRYKKSKYEKGVIPCRGQARFLINIF
jgi:hypothetical protein